jgi:anti-sigma B factor antagonist
MTPNSCAFSRLPTPTFTQYSFRQAAPFPILTKHMAIDGPLKIDREPGKAPGSVILRLTGPLTLRNIFDLQAEMRKDEPRRLTILDLTGVPYMDSAGMGLVVNYHVHCQNKGGQLVTAGVSPRILELFKMTKVDAVLRMVPTLEDAEAIA